MYSEEEFDRHNDIMVKIGKAKNKDELPCVSLDDISSYLAETVCFDDVHISKELFKPVLDAIEEYSFFTKPQVKEVFLKVLRENYPGKSEKEYFEKFRMVAKSHKIINILEEIGEIDVKLELFQEKEELDHHNKIMRDINSAFEIKDLPKVGMTQLNKRIQKDFNNNEFYKNIAVSEIKDITNAYMEELSFEVIDDLVRDYCSKLWLGEKYKKKMAYQITNSFKNDNVLKYIVTEIKAKEKRKLEIYKLNHEETMDNIKNATRVSQLPPNLTSSTLALYLSNNSTIFKKSGKIGAPDLKNVTNMLLDNKKWEDNEVILELQNICNKYYADDSGKAFNLLYDKFKTLPKTYYLVEEINFSNKRQKEFINNSCGNVNVYFIPNYKSPSDGGRFYNCYINRVNNLNLGELLPLNLNDIVPPEMDIDSIEWYIQEYYDKTFKAAGGIILNRDESIGSVNVFRPNDGNISVISEEKSKYDDLKKLSQQVKDIVKRKKENMDSYDKLQKEFLKMQEKFFKSQSDIDNQLAELEAKIDLLVDGKESDEELNRGGRHR